MTTLVVAAHPDDEVLGCGGTIARLADQGRPVFIAIMGEGITSRYEQRDQTPDRELQSLKVKSHQAAKLLGAREIKFFDLPDNRLDSLPLLEVIKPIEQLISTLKPDTVYTHHGGDLNIDHTIVHRAVLTASRPLANQSVKTVYTFEIPSSTDWAFGKLSPVFQPNTFVDIDEYLNIKVQAMQIYDIESRKLPHPRSPAALKSAAHRWGSIAGMKAAEGFQLVRKLYH
jgi:LmbE family N-acetylglucosaminyl deacetylase